jgi:hypothetical protein
MEPASELIGTFFKAEREQLEGKRNECGLLEGFNGGII